MLFKVPIPIPIPKHIKVIKKIPVEVIKHIESSQLHSLPSHYDSSPPKEDYDTYSSYDHNNHHHHSSSLSSSDWKIDRRNYLPLTSSHYSS